MPTAVVEFYGTARQVTGQKEVTIKLEEGGGEELQMPNMFNVNARRVVHDLDTQPQDGDRILLMFVTAGG